MRQTTSSDTEPANRRGARAGSIVVLGSALIIGLLLLASVVLFLNLPDANVFNDRVERIFVANDALTTSENVKLLEVLAQSGTTFSDVLQGYRVVIFILLVLSSALLLTALYFLMTNHSLNQRVKEIERSGIYIRSLTVNREEQSVYINNMEFELTEAALETLAMLCEARLDDEVITGVDLEAMITGKSRENCDEAAGATRIKRLRDHLGNQIVSQLLVRNISRKGYLLSIDKDVIRMI
jgi:DNA-binding winged helix-turn-helix (wHTH) protein